MKKLFLLTLIFAVRATATEIDSYTFRDTPLTDISPVINKFVNEKLQRTLREANQQITEVKKRGRVLTAKEIEIFVSRSLQNTMTPSLSFIEFLKNPRRQAIGEFESCIQYNNCVGWPFVERIVHQGRESVYARSDYNVFTSVYLGAMINVCGHRVGSDKLTHFFEDALLYYNIRMNGATDDELAKFMFKMEDTIMGGETSGVYSHGDVAANESGVRFYTDILQGSHPIFKLQGDQLFQDHSFSVCDYAESRWDETINKNIYTQKNAPDLERVIGEELAHPSKIEPYELLHRPVKAAGFFETASEVFGIIRTFSLEGFRATQYFQSEGRRIDSTRARAVEIKLDVSQN